MFVFNSSFNTDTKRKKPFTNCDTWSLGGNAWQGETWKKFGSQERLLHSTFGIIQMLGHVMSQIDTALGHTTQTDFGNLKLSWDFK